MGLSCVHCGVEMRRLVVHYSPGNIRLLKCGSCDMVADPYVECELMILLIDLILLKEKAYRHLLYNLLNEDLVASQGLFWKSAIAFMVLELCRSLFLCPISEDWNSSSSSFPVILFFLRIMAVLVENAAFFSTSHHLIKVLLGPSLNVMSWKDISLAILVSSYMKIFLIAMMVWEFPSSVIFIFDMFVLSSNAVALKVLTGLSKKKTTARCVGLFLTAYAAKLFSFHLLLPPPVCPPFRLGILGL